MASLPPPGTKNFPNNSLEKQCYNIAESFKENIPLPNDRNRLGYNLYKFMIGEGDPPEVIVKNARISTAGISVKEFVEKLKAEVEKIKK